MARTPDPDLEDRILDAARRLWKKGEGGESLTMRAVARAAGTNTPAVYRRFNRREEILQALIRQIKQEVYQQIEAAPSAEEACERYVDFGLHNPHEYELYYLHEHEVFAPDGPVNGGPGNGSSATKPVRRRRPSEELMKVKLAQQLGGESEDYSRLTLALWAVLHGTVMLLIRKTIPPHFEPEMRSVCRASVKALLHGEARLRG
ncbi:MAG TPA: helix-turn-helix domain-containing protein [Terriglobales bacterium]|nr:helix-turn-helix domain-containing protein [Terriglobales bacterium]